MSMHLYALLRQRAAQHPESVAIGGQQGLVWRTLTSRELLALVDRLADELRDLGVGQGERVVLWMPNHWRTPVYLFALWKLGAVAVPFDREMNPEAGARILERIAPRLILAGYGERPAWAQDARITEWWEPGTRNAATGSANHHGHSWTPPPEPLAVIVFTSGTTGTPKGVMLTHANLLFQAAAVYDRVPLDGTCRVAGILPLSHVFELGTLVYAIQSGAATHYVPSRRATDVLRVLQEQRITHMIVVPQLLTLMGHALQEKLRARLPSALYDALWKAADRVPFGPRRLLFWPVHQQLGGHLRLMIAGGAALPIETQLLWERMGVRIVPGFGTTECSPAIALAEPNGTTPLGSVGRAMRGVEVRLGEGGELLVRGPNVMAGYWQDPERTAEVLADGWYATGDLGSIDAQGNIRITGRARDLIVLPSGMNVWPQDVEAALRAHPSVKDAAVLAVPSGRGGATLHAYLLPTTPADRATSVGQIVASCNARLAQHQRVATASWWDEADFPRTAMLKVRRHLLPLPRPERAAKVEQVLALDDPVGQALSGLVHQSTVEPHHTLAELGLDSLSIVELAIALEEKTGRTIEEDALHAEMTVDEARAVVAAAPLTAASDGPGGPGASGLLEAPPRWAYTWGRPLRALMLPIDLLLRYAGQPIVLLGGEYLWPLPPQVILAGTHRSFADMPLVRYALARTGNRVLLPGLISAVVTTSFFRGVLGWIGVLVLGLHPLDQRRGRETSLRRLVGIVQASRGSILIFPQGVHTNPEAELANDPSVRFRTGVAHLAEALDLPVYPFGLAGPERVIPQTAVGFAGPALGGIPLSVRQGPLAIAFGPPLRLLPGEAPQAFTARLQEACYRLAREAEAAIDHPATHPEPRPSASKEQRVLTPR
ncbi:MAG: AMP-binding protein [Chloroflexi bacterium]|nr:AMP-binding protein [Chloroflexota bacterium]